LPKKPALTLSIMSTKRSLPSALFADSTTRLGF
jgi:hypothetical protein